MAEGLLHFSWLLEPVSQNFVARLFAADRLC